MFRPFDPNAAAQPDAGIFGLKTSAHDAQVILIPVPFEATTSYGAGTARGPEAILRASHQVDLLEPLFGAPYEAGIHLLPLSAALQGWNVQARTEVLRVLSAGGEAEETPLAESLQVINQLSQKVNAWVEAQAEQHLEQGKLIGVVGGDHSTPLGAIRALARRHPDLGILHIDAHADLRDAYEGFHYSHASIMFNVLKEVPTLGRLVQVGIRDFCEAEATLIAASGGKVVTFFDAWLAARKADGGTFRALAALIVDQLPGEVYVSFDIDGLDPSLCPNTGTPVPGGLSWQEAGILLEALVLSGRRIVGFDLNEVAPGSSGSEWDANVGARLLYRLIGAMLVSQGVGERTQLEPML